MNSRRLRLYTILGIPLAGALVLLSATQLWWTVAVPGREIEVLGTDASPALSALSLTGFALAAALAISGPVFRIILGVLQVALGGTIVFAAFASINDPTQSSTALVTAATGVAGPESVSALIESIALTGWPWLAVAGGALSTLLGLLLLATSRRWPTASRKYQAVRLEAENPDSTSPRDSVGDWDALSDGTDPTDR